MGGKFGSINIRGGDVKYIQPLVPEYVIRKVSNNWVTGAGEDFEWGATSNTAQRLSKAIQETVLAVEYFDDDYVEFILYQDGKITAAHIPASYDEFLCKPGRVESFSSALSLSQEDEEILRSIFLETDPEMSVSLMESFFGCPIYADADILRGLRFYKKEVYKNRKYVENYLGHKKEEAKIKNQTELILCSEREGGLGQAGVGAYPTRPIVYRKEQSSYPKELFPVEVWDVDSNGALMKLFSVNTPKKMGMQLWVNRAHGITVLEYDSEDMSPASINVFSDDGILLDSLDSRPFLNRYSFTSKPVVFDESRILISGKCYNFRKGQLEWSCHPEGEKKIWAAPIMLPNDKLLCSYHDHEINKTIMCFMENGGLGGKQITFSLAQGWEQPIVYRENIFIFYCNDQCKDRLVCYDLNLNEQWHFDFKKSYVFMEPAIDEEMGVLYFQKTPKITAAFDLRHRKIIAESKPAHHKYSYLAAFLPGIGPVCRRNDSSSIDILDRNLQLISTHKTEGDICDIYSRDGRIFILTYRKEEADWSYDNTIYCCSIKKQGHTFVYELKS